MGEALKKAVGGGVPGAVAMVLQVLLLMWLRTTVNYQMRHGGSMADVMRLLYAEGGIRRFYSGVGVARAPRPSSESARPEGGGGGTRTIS